MAELQKKLQELSEEFQQLQTGSSSLFGRSTRWRLIITQELTSTVQARQKLESQQQENKNVQAEFALLKDDANIYKLVGSVLLKQDKTEAVMAVDGRLQYIEKEIERVEKQISGIQEKSEKKKMEVCFD
jgi:prefoldin beta subunit